MSSFHQKLQEIYQRQNKITPLIEGLEGEIPQQTLDDLYVKLKIITKEDDEAKSTNYEKISGKKEEVALEALFDSLSNEKNADKVSIKKLLIVGGAGKGKSTLMQYIAYKWSKGELWNDKFDYVYRVPLRILLTQDWHEGYTHAQKQDDILKCLVHSFLTDELTEEERRNFRLEHMPWLNKKERILFLLDGYDEVAHKRNGFTKRILEGIFHHQNLILTSRPNALSKEMKENFGRKIENKGFDQKGINQYLTWYFQNNKTKGLAFEEFLEKNPLIRKICKTPVNIAMICFIWSEGDSNKVFHKVSNLNDLYDQVVDHLGFRYYAKQLDNLGKCREELLSEWKGGKIKLDELEVLQHIAYKGMTGEHIETADDKKSETLIIRGMTKRGDRHGISIQSSINYLEEIEFNRKMPTINKVYKFGLLKPKGIFPTEKEPSETDLQSHNFSFLHLSFQEFLTAKYLAEKLMTPKNEEEQRNIANFIARHRNESRYSSTLKFMAGIFSSEKYKDNESGIKIFWDSIMCNIDGILEFGAEAKVILLMNLLSQATRKTERIPERAVAVGLIDSIVLRDIADWYTYLKESGYTSHNIMEGLIQSLGSNYEVWLSTKSDELQEILRSKLKIKNKKSRNTLVEEAFYTIEVMILKFSEQQQQRIFLKTVEILKEYSKENSKETWRSTYKAIDCILIIHKKLKLNIRQKEIFDHLLVTIYDSNLYEISCQAIEEIIKNSPSFLKTISCKIKVELETLDVKTQGPELESRISILRLSQFCDIQLVQETIHFLTLLFQSSSLKVRMFASRNLGNLLKVNGNMTSSQLAREISKTLIPLLGDYTLSFYTNFEPILQFIKRNHSNDPQLVEHTIQNLLSLLQYIFTKNSLQWTLSSTTKILNVLLEFVKIVRKEKLHLVKTVLNALLPFLEYPGKESSAAIVELIEIGEESGLHLIQETLSMLINQLQDNDLNSRKSTSQIIIGFIEINVNERTQLAKDTIKRLTALLNDSPDHKSDSFFKRILGFISSGGNNDLQLVRQDCNDDVKNNILDTIIELTLLDREVPFGDFRAGIQI